MAASQPDFGKEARRAQEMIAAGIEDDDVVVATVTGDVRGMFKTMSLNNVASVTQTTDHCFFFLYQRVSSSGPSFDPGIFSCLSSTVNSPLSVEAGLIVGVTDHI